MIPAQAATQKIAPRGDLEVVQRARRPLLAEDERDAGHDGDGEQAEREHALARDRREVDRRGSARRRGPPTGSPPRLSTGSVVSLTWLGTKRSAMTRATTASGSVTRKTEPHSKCSSRNPETSGPSAAMAPPSADHRAIERVRAGPGPQGGDQREGRRVGHAGGHAAEDPGDDQDLDRRGERREEAGRDRQQHAEDEHQLAAVAVAEGAEPEDRRRQPERVADRHQVERGLRRVERLADGGQGDVRDRQVQVGDGRDQDQREQDEWPFSGPPPVAVAGGVGVVVAGAWVVEIPSSGGR